MLFVRGECNAGNCIASYCPGRNLRRVFFTGDQDKLYLPPASYTNYKGAVTVWYQNPYRWVDKTREASPDAVES